MLRHRLNAEFPQPPSADTTTTSSSSSSSTNDVRPSILITVLILAITVILFASLYLLLRFLRRNRHRDAYTSDTIPRTVSSQSLRRLSPEIDSLPLFTYDRLTAKNGGDCAVCLSKFEHKDVLRLLPICCHVFHATCIDTWLSANLTCPLCRSPIFLTSGEILGKLDGENSRSFRVEIGNVSNRHNSGEIRRSYSLGGDFDYVIAADEVAIADVTPTSIPRNTSYKVADTTAEQQQGALAAEVGARGGGWWLKDYLSSSRTSSFRSSGRFFTGSSRRSTVETTAGNRENGLVEFDGASRLGDEIGELFRWLSGV
ncbi:hypothetical protein RND81_02G103600 [Saponaria officinalis]|uniref:RING-type domain-containing protein n=1 Tax=Saponaria officinalis TaxID=3572 RepID=A0AAW1MLY7_SAPOF